jgi:hypothetical protein
MVRRERTISVLPLGSTLGPVFACEPGAVNLSRFRRGAPGYRKNFSRPNACGNALSDELQRASSFQLVAFAANDLANDAFGFRIPIPRATMIADTDEQLDVAEHVTFVCPLLEGDILGSFDEAALFAEIARAAIFRLFHLLDLRLFIRSIFAPFCARPV